MVQGLTTVGGGRTGGISLSGIPEVHTLGDVPGMEYSVVPNDAETHQRKRDTKGIVSFTLTHHNFSLKKLRPRVA